MSLISFQVLTAPGCTHCKDTLEYWETIQGEFPEVEMQELSALTDEGQSLAATHHIFATPGLVINDELFSTGSFEPEKLKARFIELTQTTQE